MFVYILNMYRSSSSVTKSTSKVQCITMLKHFLFSLTCLLSPPLLSVSILQNKWSLHRPTPSKRGPFPLRIFPKVFYHFMEVLPYENTSSIQCCQLKFDCQKLIPCKYSMIKITWFLFCLLKVSKSPIKISVFEL